MKLTALLLATVLTCGCGPMFHPIDPLRDTTSVSSLDTLVVKSQALFEISTANPLTQSSNETGNPTKIPVSVVFAPDVTMTVDASQFKVPTLIAAKLDFGTVRITDFKDNNLKVCGSDGRTRCTKAIIRAYTTGTAGDGLYNAAASYGLPIFASLKGAAEQLVGLNIGQAAFVQTFEIAAKQNTLRLSDFPEKPEYQIQIDFSNAGAGTFATTLVIEYGLQ